MKKIIFLTLLLPTFFFQIQAQCPNYSRVGIHVVKSGENLYRIAKLYNISLIELADWNNIATTTILHACQELAVSDNSNMGFAQPDNYFTERSQNNSNYGTTFGKQSGTKHIVRKGETISGLARLYGYTEERFRAFNLLKSGENLSVGSSILSTDCACDRVSTYEELNRGYSSNNNTTTTNNYVDNNTVNSNYRRDNYQPRGSGYDNFYDEPQGRTAYNFGNNTPPPAQPVSNQIRSVTNPEAYDTGSYDNSLLTKAAATYMSSEELRMLDEINLVRSNPTGYIPFIEAYKRDIQSGKSFGSSLAVCDELIAELNRTPPLSILKPTPCIYTAAKKHGLDQLARGSTGHNGSDGSWPWDRVKRECPKMTDGNENLVGGPTSVREAVILLLVDDGIPSRGHRKTMLGKDWIYGACYKIGKVGFMPNCWVQKFGY